MTRDDIAPKLDAFMSGELTNEERMEVETHLQMCARCRAELAALQQWKSLVREAGKQFTASPQFRKKIEKKYGWERRSGYRLPVWAKALVACGVLAGMALVVLSYRSTLARKEIFSEIVHQHSSILSAGRGLDVTSSDYKVVESWFMGKLPFRLRIPDLKDTPFSLLGGRLVYLNQMPGAQLVFRWKGAEVSAFVLMASPALGRSLPQHDIVSRRAPFNLEVCGEKALRYLIVGDVDTETVHQIADLMEASE